MTAPSKLAHGSCICISYHFFFQQIRSHKTIPSSKHVKYCGQNGDIPLSAKSSSKMPNFLNYLGIRPCFETRFSKNRVST